MEKAQKALRRSGVRIKSIGSGYSDLQMVISQLKDVRVASKGFATAQSSAMQDLVKWSLKDENRAIQDALTQIGELFAIWTEVQREFSDHMKEFRVQFEMILEGARQLDVARTNLATAEQKETKTKKDLKKAAKKAPAEEIRELSVRLTEAEREKDMAMLEVNDRVREHEVVKLIRIKEGLFKVSEAYIDYAQKGDVLFNAQREIALQIPDVTDCDIQDIKYTGSGATMQAVARAKDKIKRFRRRRASTLSAATPDHTADDLPPPYSENPPVNPFYNEYLHAVDSSNPYSTPNSTVNSANVSTNEASFTHGGRMSLDARPQSNLVSPVVPPSSYPGHHLPFSPPADHPPLYRLDQDAPRRTSYQECTTPPYQQEDPFSHVTRRTPRQTPLRRRNSYFSDAEDVTEAIQNINLSLDKR